MTNSLNLYHVQGKTYLGGVKVGGIQGSYTRLHVGTSAEEVAQTAVSQLMKDTEYQLEPTIVLLDKIDGYKIVVLKKEKQQVANEDTDVRFYVVEGMSFFAKSRTYYLGYHVGKTENEVIESGHNKMKEELKEVKEEFEFDARAILRQEIDGYTIHLVKETTEVIQ